MLLSFIVGLVILLFIVTGLFIFILFTMDKNNRKEREYHLDFIDRLQNKLMSRDYGDYTNQSRIKGLKVTNPFMERLNQRLKARSDLRRNESSEESDDDEDKE